MTESQRLDQRVLEFVQEVVSHLGPGLTASLETTPEGLRVDVSGGDTEPLLRRKGEALEALQQVVNAVFRHAVADNSRLVVDCSGFRKARDREIQQIAKFLMEKVRASGAPQELGPLNSYARRLVHLEVAAAPDLASESQGDGAVKTVVISKRPGR
jgi:spoIIIJ-associated protein